MTQIVIILLLFIILHSRTERDKFYICSMFFTAVYGCSYFQ